MAPAQGILLALQQLESLPVGRLPLLLNIAIPLPWCWRQPAPAQGILLALQQLDSLAVGCLPLCLGLQACLLCCIPV